MGLYKQLKEKYPLMYNQGDVSVGEGWDRIIFELSQQIQADHPLHLRIFLYQDLPLIMVI